MNIIFKSFFTVVLAKKPHKRTICYEEIEDKTVLKTMYVQLPTTIYIVKYERSLVFLKRGVSLQVAFCHNDKPTLIDQVYVPPFGNTSFSDLSVCLGNLYPKQWNFSLRKMYEKIINAYWTTKFNCIHMPTGFTLEDWVRTSKTREKVFPWQKADPILGYKHERLFSLLFENTVFNSQYDLDIP